MKGISAFIATALLIVFTVAIGGMISLWLTGFTSTTTKTISGESGNKTTCMYAGISLRNLNFANPYLTGRIENTGNVVLGNINLQILYQNASTQKIPLCLVSGTAQACTSSDIILSQSNVISFSVSSGSNYDKIRLTSNCSGVADEAERIDVTTS